MAANTDFIDASGEWPGAGSDATSADFRTFEFQEEEALNRRAAGEALNRRAAKRKAAGKRSSRHGSFAVGGHGSLSRPAIEGLLSGFSGRVRLSEKRALSRANNRLPGAIQ
jgi:hypothetical protein